MTTRRSFLRLLNSFFSCHTLLALILVLSGSGAATLRGEESQSSAKEESITLPKLSVKGEPVCSFGIGIVGTRDSKTKKIQRLFISVVVPGSTAEQRGLKVGDEILAINGRKVAGAEGEIKRGAWLFDQLADQEPGQTIDLEVAVRVVKQVTLRAIIQ